MCTVLIIFLWWNVYRRPVLNESVIIYGGSNAWFVDIIRLKRTLNQVIYMTLLWNFTYANRHYVNFQLNLPSLFHELNSVYKLKKVATLGQPYPISPNWAEINKWSSRTRTILETLERASPKPVVCFSLKKKKKRKEKQSKAQFSFKTGKSQIHSYWQCQYVLLALYQIQGHNGTLLSQLYLGEKVIERNK